MTGGGRTASGERAARARGCPSARAMARGFTLIELVVAVAIMALATAAVLPQINGLTRAELRRASRQLAASVRRTFDDAALTGQIHRMTFTLSEPAGAGEGDAPPTAPIVIEASELTLNFEGHDGALREAANANDDFGASSSPFGSNFGAGDDAAPLTGVDGGSGADADAAGTDSAANNLFQDMFAINRLGRRADQPNFDLTGTVALPAGVQVTDVWVEGMHDATAEGSVSLVFFPTGYTQRARLHLQDAHKNTFTLEVEPLTGQVWVAEGYYKDLLETVQ